jgi:hypothetical protein
MELTRRISKTRLRGAGMPPAGLPVAGGPGRQNLLHSLMRQLQELRSVAE